MMDGHHSSTDIPIVHEDAPLLAGLDENRDFYALDDETNKDWENLQDNDEDVVDDGDFSFADVSAMVEAVETVVVAVKEEAHEVAEAVMEEFQEANESNFHYLEMGLTRNFSILPGDIIAVAEGEGPLSVLGDDVSVLTLDTGKMETGSVPLSAYVLLLSAVVCLSSIGPLLKVQDDATSCMKIVWRMTGTSLLLLPLAGYEVYTSGFPKLTWAQWFTFLLSTTCYDVSSLAFVISLSYTAVGNAVILSNSLALILLVGKIFVGERVSWIEGGGALIAFGGAALCSKDSTDSRGDGSNALLGDALAILSALGGVGYLIFAKSSRSNMSMYIFMFLTMFVGSILARFFQISILGETSTFDMNYRHGFWGFLMPVPHRLPLEFVIVIVCNLCGTMGYVRAMQYFDNLVISSAALMEPVTAEFLAFGFGVSGLPGIQGWIGNALVAGGTLAVIYQDGKGKSPTAP